MEVIQGRLGEQKTLIAMPTCRKQELERIYITWTEIFLMRCLLLKDMVLVARLGPIQQPIFIRQYQNLQKILALTLKCWRNSGSFSIILSPNIEFFTFLPLDFVNFCENTKLLDSKSKYDKMTLFIFYTFFFNKNECQQLKPTKFIWQVTNCINFFKQYVHNAGTSFSAFVCMHACIQWYRNFTCEYSRTARVIDPWLILRNSIYLSM
eukprot:TRINITY_DN8899_c0_g3_i2.p2 TRINITY_DN8899_c0_g3~~TRINITY_DN8899_c0_g3_i2.p2  ORF type:complete len:208 (+),score=-13.20 TRINITY_DN8899_c0_g3_i2:2-625(+)